MRGRETVGRALQEKRADRTAGISSERSLVDAAMIANPILILALVASS